MRELSCRLESFLASLPQPAEEYEHRIGELVRSILKCLKVSGLYMEEPERIDLVAELSDFHDIGKLYIPRKILNKPGPLTPEECAVVRQHPLWGKKIVEREGAGCSREEVRLASDICLLHHERCDGRGYPRGLKGKQIPLEIQAVSLADAFDALCSERRYKKALSWQEAVELICGGQCGCFQPKFYHILRALPEACGNKKT